MSGRIVALRHAFRLHSAPYRLTLRVAPSPLCAIVCASRPRAFSTAPAGEDIKPAAEPIAETGADPDAEKQASPYVISSELVVYETPAVVPELLTGVRQQFMAGAGLASVAFAAVGACIATTTAPTTLALLVAALSVNAATLVTYTQQSLKGLATKHVEKIVLLPVDPSKDAQGGGEQGTAAERLAATDQVRVLVRSANVERTLLLTNVAAAWQGARYAGLVSDDRIEFGTVCTRLRLLDADPEAATSKDLPLLLALLSSPKVIAEELIECRADVPEIMRVKDDFPGLKLSAKTQSEAKRVPEGMPRSPPIDDIKNLGKRAIRGGILMLCGAALFVVKKNKEENGDSLPPLIERRK